MSNLLIYLLNLALIQLQLKVKNNVETKKNDDIYALCIAINHGAIVARNLKVSRGFSSAKLTINNS